MNANLPSKPVDVPTNLDEARIISNSEVDAYLTCERKHMFGFGFNKESKHPSRALQIGIAGHEVMAHFYRAIQAGANVSEARQEAMILLTEFLIGGKYEPEALAVAQILVSRYIDQDTLATGAKILEVEKDFYLPVSDSYWYGMRLDLLVSPTIGRLAGSVLLIDHKFTYDFYSPDDLLLNVQMLKYAGTVRYNGYPVHEAYLNQFRTRFPSHLIQKKTNDDLFKRMPVGLEDSRIRSALKTQIKASERILYMRALPLELWQEEALPTQNKMVCRACPFKNPCQMMEAEMPAQKALGGEFQNRSYGYNSDSEEASDG